MKIFHMEDGKEVVYVQVQDLMYIDSTVPVIPATIWESICQKLLGDEGKVFVTDANRFDFIRFECEEEVDYFKKMDFIVDFNEYKNYTDKQMFEACNKFIKKANDLEKTWSNMSEAEKKQNKQMLQEYDHLEYILSWLFEICAIKLDKGRTNLPDFAKN